MNPEGKLHIRLRPGASGIAVQIESQRPVLACRVFEGKSVADSLKLIPLLFSICAQAQSVTAVRAIESAQGKAAGRSVENRRELLLALESLREHLWRVLMDWPALQAKAPQAARLAPLNQQLQQLIKQLNPDGSLTQQPGLSLPGATLAASTTQRWASLREALQTLLDDPALRVLPPSLHTLGNLSAALMPLLPTPELLARLQGEAADTFVAAPDWHGEVFETGSLQRLANNEKLIQTSQTYGFGVYTRLMARLIEMAELMQRIDAGMAESTLNGNGSAAAGVAQLDAVRGRLVHAVQIESGQIRRYRILAPTEWNFHPRGIAARMLASLPGRDNAALQLQARWVIQAIDPCVGYALQIERD